MHSPRDDELVGGRVLHALGQPPRRGIAAARLWLMPDLAPNADRQPVRTKHFSCAMHELVRRRVHARSWAATPAARTCSTARRSPPGSDPDWPNAAVQASAGPDERVVQLRGRLTTVSNKACCADHFAVYTEQDKDLLAVIGVGYCMGEDAGLCISTAGFAWLSSSLIRTGWLA